MTTINTATIPDLTDGAIMSAEESPWSRMVRQIGSMFGRIWGHMNERIGPVDGNDECFPTDGWCL